MAITVNTFVATKVLVQLLLTPPGLLMSGLLAGALLSLFRLPRVGRLVAALAVLQAVLLSSTPVADALLLPLEDQARAAASAAPLCCYDYIVVLGGGMSPAIPPLRPDPALHANRVWHAASLHHRGLAPRIILSGGSFASSSSGPSQTEAKAMRGVLLDLGVPAVRMVLEGRSLNTLENIRVVRALVGAGRVALITSGLHMPRALFLARRTRLNASAFPTAWRVLASARQT